MKGVLKRGRKRRIECFERKRREDEKTKTRRDEVSG